MSDRRAEMLSAMAAMSYALAVYDRLLGDVVEVKSWDEYHTLCKGRAGLLDAGYAMRQVSGWTISEVRAEAEAMGLTNGGTR